MIHTPPMASDERMSLEEEAALLGESYPEEPTPAARHLSATVESQQTQMFDQVLEFQRNNPVTIWVVAACIALVAGYVTQQPAGLFAGLAIAGAAVFLMMYLPSVDRVIKLLPRYMGVIFQRMTDIPETRTSIIHVVFNQLATLDSRALKNFLREAKTALGKVRNDKRQAAAEAIVSTFLQEIGPHTAVEHLATLGRDTAIAAISKLPIDLLVQLASGQLTAEPAFLARFRETLPEDERTRLVVSLGSGSGSVAALLNTATSVLPPSPARAQFIAGVEGLHSEYLRVRRIEVEAMVAALIEDIRGLHNNALATSGDLSATFHTRVREGLAKLMAMVIGHDLDDRACGLRLEIELHDHELQQIENKIGGIGEDQLARAIYVNARGEVAARIAKLEEQCTALTNRQQVLAFRPAAELQTVGS